MPVPLSRADAQRRADQIRAFRAELDALRREGLTPLPPDALQALGNHHDALLAALAARYDIDRSASGKRMSLGMRLASAFGAAALVAAVVSFFYRIWGALSLPIQVTALTLAPIAAVAAMAVAIRRERTLHVASLCAIVACGAFVLQTVMLGLVFNLHATPHVIGSWSAFAFLVSVPWRLTLPFTWAVLTLLVYAAALELHLAGAAWTGVPHPELLMLPAALAWAGARAVPGELAPFARGAALAVLLGAILALSTFDSSSLLPWTPGVATSVYQVAAVVLAVGVIVLGIRNGQRETLVIGAIFAGLFLFGRFVDWWWDWMPKYLFFLILAAVSMAWLWMLIRLRRMLEVPA